MFTYLKQLLVFVNCAISTLKCALYHREYNHVIDHEAADSLRITWITKYS